MPNSIFFSKKGAKNSQFAADCQSENLKYKNLTCNEQIPRQDQRKGSSYLTKVWIKCWFSVNTLFYQVHTLS